MTRHPFDSGELGRDDPEMDRLGESLEQYATDAAGDSSPDLSSRIMAAIDDEPVPSRGWWGSLLAAFAPWHGPARLALGAAVVVVAVIGAVAVGDLADRARNNTGATPSPTEVFSPSPTPSASPTPSPSPSATPSPTPSATPTPTSVPATPMPTATDDHGGDLDTPSPSESDNSGPGGGNSGPGGGG